MLRQVVVLALFLTVCESAVLLRFINTVPARLTRESVDTAVTAPASRISFQGNAPNKANVDIDRVGLHYFATTTNGVVSSPTLVWTQILQEDELSGNTAPYAWYFAMPPLRAYHTPKTATATEAVAVDRPLGTATDATVFQPDQFDTYEQTRLKADGVGLYLSFAAGTYRMEAYGATTGSTVTGAASLAVGTILDKSFSESGTTLTFVDNAVYTLIATGTPNWPTQSGSSVSLVLIKEDVSPVATFGSASLRWFHAIQTQASSAIDIYNGSGFSTANKLATGIAFGTVSAYFDVTPGTAKEFPVATASSGTIASATPLASSTVVQVDLRAGTRATVICAITDTTAGSVFCRTIPSRAVAFVRLIHDAAGQDSLVQGRYGSQKLSETSLSLSASYEFPRPEEMTESSQVPGGISTGHPATTEGLYPVVVNVAPNTVSGYGEVFVPLFIMDFAVRFLITADFGTERTSTNTGGFATGGNNDFTGQTWFLFAPVFKRVHFQLNTDGFATLTGRSSTNDASTTNGDPYPFVGDAQSGLQNVVTGANQRFTAVATGTQDLAKTLTTDIYMEPGQFYSLFVIAADPSGTFLSYSVQKSGIISLSIRLDRTVAQVAQGVSSGNGLLTLIPFAPGQQFNPTAAPVVSGSFTLQLSGSSTVPTTTDLGTIGKSTVAPLTATAKAALAQDVNTQLTPGTYTWTYTLLNTNNVATAPCLNNIPGPGSLTITAGTLTDLFVLNSYGCRKNTNDATKLAVTVVTRQSAVATGHSPSSTSNTATPAASTRSTRSYLSSVPFYSAASHSASMSAFALLAALIALVFLAL